MTINTGLCLLKMAKMTKVKWFKLRVCFQVLCFFVVFRLGNGGVGLVASGPAILFPRLNRIKMLKLPTESQN